MNWIIRKTNKLRCHTVLTELFKPIYDEIENYNWIIADIEIGGTPYYSDLVITQDKDYFILSPQGFKEIVERDFQIYWGVILGVPIGIEIKIDEDSIPYVEGNPFIFENGHIQYPDAQIEIDCFDSGYTLIKFKDEALSKKFKNYFDEALTIDAFNLKWK